jgi:hypothetical protein
MCFVRVFAELRRNQLLTLRSIFGSWEAPLLLGGLKTNDPCKSANRPIDSWKGKARDLCKSANRHTHAGSQSFLLWSKKWEETIPVFIPPLSPLYFPPPNSRRPELPPPGEKERERERDRECRRQFADNGQGNGVLFQQKSVFHSLFIANPKLER